MNDPCLLISGDEFRTLWTERMQTLLNSEDVAGSQFVAVHSKFRLHIVY